MSDTFEERRMLLLRHELGHWLVAKHHNFTADRIKIQIIYRRPSYLPNGSSKIFPVPVLTADGDVTQELITYLEQRIQVLYAGTIAQTIHLENLSSDETTEILLTDGAEDFRVAQELQPMLLGLLRKSGAPHEQTDQELTDQITEKAWVDAHLVIDGIKAKLIWMADELGKRVQETGIAYRFELDELKTLERRFASESATVN